MNSTFKYRCRIPKVEKWAIEAIPDSLLFTRVSYYCRNGTDAAAGTAESVGCGGGGDATNFLQLLLQNNFECGEALEEKNFMNWLGCHILTTQAPFT